MKPFSRFHMEPVSNIRYFYLDLFVVESVDEVLPVHAEAGLVKLEQTNRRVLVVRRDAWGGIHKRNFCKKLRLLAAGLFFSDLRFPRAIGLEFYSSI